MIEKADAAVEVLMHLWDDEKIPSCLDVLKSIRDTGLFKVASRVDELLTELSQGRKRKGYCSKKCIICTVL